MHRGDIEQNTQDKVKPIIRFYNIHKYINADADVTMAQWQNIPFTGNIYNKLPNKKQTRECIV